MSEFRVAFNLSTGLLGGAFLFSSLSTTGCFFSHAKPAPRAFRPPPVQVQPVVVTANAVIEESGPELELEAPDNPVNAATLPMPELPGPPKPPAPRPQVKASAPPPEPPIVPPPKITQLFTADQRNELIRSYGEFLNMLARDLQKLSKKRLSADQTSQMERIRVFKGQAEDLFKHGDLVTAVQLVQRAFNLAEDLVSRVR
jgi:hypothetical protein